MSMPVTELRISQLSTFLLDNKFDEYVKQCKDIVIALNEPLKEAFLSSDVDVAKQQMILREKIGANASLTSASKAYPYVQHLEQKSIGTLKNLRTKLQDSLQVIFAANSAESDSENKLFFQILTDEKNAAYQYKNTHILIFNYAVVSIKLEERTFAIDILAKLFEEVVKYPKSNLNENLNLFQFNVALIYLEQLTQIQFFFKISEAFLTISNEEFAHFDKNLKRVILTGNAVIKFCETKLDEETLIQPRYLSEIKFRLCFLKSRIKVLENNIKQARKEIKSAIDVFQHEVKQQDTQENISVLSLNGLPLCNPAFQQNDMNLQSFLNTSSLCLKANLEYLKNNHKKSVKLLQSALKLGLQPGLFFNNMACIHDSLQEHATALLYLEKADTEFKEYSITPFKRASTFFNIGLQLLYLENNETAIEYLLESTNVLGNKPEVWLLLSRAIVNIVTKSRQEFDNNINKKISQYLVNELQKGLTFKTVLEDYYSLLLEAQTQKSPAIRSKVTEGLLYIDSCLDILATAHKLTLNQYINQVTFSSFDDASFDNFDNIPQLSFETAQVLMECLLNKCFLYLELGDSSVVCCSALYLYKLIKLKLSLIDQHFSDSEKKQSLSDDVAKFLLTHKLSYTKNMIVTLTYLSEACLKYISPLEKQARYFAEKATKEVNSLKEFCHEQSHELKRFSIEVSSLLREISAITLTNLSITSAGAEDVKQVMVTLKKGLDQVEEEDQTHKLTPSILRVAYIAALKSGNLETAVEVVGKGTIRT